MIIDERTVFWVDDEPNLMDSELFDLINNGFTPLPFQWVGSALSWLVDQKEQIQRLRGIVVDVQMPSRGDPRFTSESGVPVGVRFCQALLEHDAVWDQARSKIILYTRLPGSSLAARHASNFAEANGLQFRKKSAVSRVAIELIKEDLLRGQTKQG